MRWANLYAALSVTAPTGVGGAVRRAELLEEGTGAGCRRSPGSTAARSAGVSAEPAVRDAAWWKAAVVYQIYPRSFADSDGDGIGDLRRHHGAPRPPRRARRRRRLAVADLPVAAGRQRLRHQRLPGHRPDVRDAGGLRRAARRPCTTRGMKLVMDLVVNHTSDEHPWFVESRSSTDNPKRDWYWWRPPRDGMRAGDPGAEPTNWRSFFSGPAWELDEASGEYYLHLFSRKQPDLNWENPEVRAGGLRDDALVAGPRGRRLPHGRHQHDLQGPGAARRAAAPARRYGDGTPHFICGPRIHEFLAGDAPRGLRRPRRRAAHRRRDAGRHRRGGAAVHRPGARRGRHGLPVRARPARPGRAPSGTCTRCGCAT